MEELKLIFCLLSSVVILIAGTAIGMIGCVLLLVGLNGIVEAIAVSIQITQYPFIVRLAGLVATLPFVVAAFVLTVVWMLTRLADWIWGSQER